MQGVELVDVASSRRRVYFYGQLLHNPVEIQTHLGGQVLVAQYQGLPLYLFTSLVGSGSNAPAPRVISTGPRIVDILCGSLLSLRHSSYTP